MASDKKKKKELRALSRALPHYGREMYLRAFLLGFFTLMVCLVPVMIFEKGCFIYYGDYNAQQIPFYNMVNDTVRSGQFGWNWFTDLGSDLMTSYSFYLFGSPFFWLSVLLPRSLVTYSMPFLLALKHGFASLTAYIYIRRFVRSRHAALIGGLLYAFSGFQLFNIFFNHFQDVTAFFPLMLIAMEENINNRRKGWFAVVVGAMAVINYYFFCGQAVFLMMYYLMRLGSSDFRTSWKKFFGLVLEAVLGTALAGFMLLPSALSLLGNYRISERLYGQDFVIYSDGTIIPRIIQTFFMPADPPALPNLFGSEYGRWASIGGYFPLFGMLGVITFVRSHKKHWAVRLSLTCLIFAFIPILNSLFQLANSYYYARWFYMPILILAMMTAQSLDDDSADFMPAIKISAAVLAVLAIIGLLPDKLEDGTVIQFSFPGEFGYFYITLAVAAFSLLIAGYICDAKKRGIRIGSAAVITTAFFSAGCVLTMILYGAVTPETAELYINADINGKDVVYEEVSEDNFFRADISENNDNYPMFWRLPNMRAFQSVVSPSIMEFYNEIGIQRDVASRADVSHYTLRGLFSVKYFYREITDENRNVDPNSAIPEVEEHENDPSDIEAANSKFGVNLFGTISTNVSIPEHLPGFEYVSENEYYRVYENKLFVPMGFGYDRYISETDAGELKKSAREKILMKALVLSDEQIEKYSGFMKKVSAEDTASPSKSDYEKWCREKQEVSSESFTWDSHGFESVIELDDPQLVFFSVPYSDGWTVEVNGTPAEVEKVSYGFMAVRANKGRNTITFSYTTPGFRAGLLISMGGLLLLIAWLLLCKVTKKERDDYNISHYYDYSSDLKVAASELYCRSNAAGIHRITEKKRSLIKLQRPETPVSQPIAPAPELTDSTDNTGDSRETEE